MVFLIQRTLIWCLLISVFTGGAVAYADKIYLKDGTVQESDRVWKSASFIHFILSGTQGVEIRYAKEIVARVQIDGVEEIIGAIAPESPPATKEPKALPSASVLSDTGERELQTQPLVIDRQIIKTHKGLEFYAPRRQQRYWAANNSKHATLNGALNALSQIYGRSTSWVEHHMGAENDLSAIHRNLISKHEQESGQTLVTEAKAPQIVVPLPHAPNAEETSVVESETVIRAEAASEAILERVPKGLEFYKPRRKEKYWTGNEGRYNSLADAMRALAKQYGVNKEWIDQHMGNTNDLTKIHQNIQNSLKK